MDSLLDSLPLFADPHIRRKDRQAPTHRDFRETVRTFNAFGQATRELLDGPIPYLINEFWTSGQRQSHSLHEISYRACFKAQLPGFFIEHLTGRGDAVYDPFMGRGTTLVEAALRGRLPVGNDVNPLSKLLARRVLLLPASIKSRPTLRASTGPGSRIESSPIFSRSTVLRRCRGSRRFGPGCLKERRSTPLQIRSTTGSE